MKQVALITGAGEGIGKAIALRLAQDGYTIVVNDLNEKTAIKTVQEIQNMGQEAMSIIADVSLDENCHAMIEQVIQTYGRIDVLVNNAGICPIRFLDDVTTEIFERTLRINLTSMFMCSKYAATYMKNQGSGMIINAASQAAFTQHPASIEYGTTKWAIRGFTRYLAEELAPYHIRVNAYAPGKIWTEMQERNTAAICQAKGLDREVYMKSVLAGIPIGRVLQAKEVADLVAYLVSPEASGMNGQTIMINGGEEMC